MTSAARCLAALAVLAFAAPAVQAGNCERRPRPAYFAFVAPPDPGEVVIQLCDRARIRQARKLVRTQGALGVMGRIVPTPAAWNPGWSFHLAPDSVRFFELATEVCDAAPSYVEAHLAEVGGSFLPGGTWCPWSSRLVREVAP